MCKGGGVKGVGKRVVSWGKALECALPDLVPGPRSLMHGGEPGLRGWLTRRIHAVYASLVS